MTIQSHTVTQLLAGIGLLGVASAVVADAAWRSETLVLRELSVTTYSGTMNDAEDHPVMHIDNLDDPRPIGAGRGAGTWVFINNKLVGYTDGADKGVMRGVCWTLDHGPRGPWTGALWIGEGGPFNSLCEMTYVLEGGQIAARGDVDMAAVEQDDPGVMAIVGGTGKYRGAIGEATFQQDPPGQPITYKLTLDLSTPVIPGVRGGNAP